MNLNKCIHSRAFKFETRSPLGVCGECLLRSSELETRLRPHLTPTTATAAPCRLHGSCFLSSPAPPPLLPGRSVFVWAPRHGQCRVCVSDVPLCLLLHKHKARTCLVIIYKTSDCERTHETRPAAKKTKPPLLHLISPTCFVFRSLRLFV